MVNFQEETSHLFLWVLDLDMHTDVGIVAVALRVRVVQLHLVVAHHLKHFIKYRK